MSWLLSPVGGIAKLSNISNVTISSIASGELLKWSGTAWINQTLAEAGVSVVGHLHDSITDTNLVDKSAAETITGDWGFQGKTGFYSTAPIVQQTGVAVSAASIHAALVNLGLITA